MPTTAQQIAALNSSIATLTKSVATLKARFTTLEGLVKELQARPTFKIAAEEPPYTDQVSGDLVFLDPSFK